MQRQRRRPVYYSAHCLNDGTIIAALPIRKPVRKKGEHEENYIDGVCREWPFSEKELSEQSMEIKIRFLDIISTRLNTRRAIREVICPSLCKLHTEVEQLRDKLDQIHELLSRKEQSHT